MDDPRGMTPFLVIIFSSKQTIKRVLAPFATRATMRSRYAHSGRLADVSPLSLSDMRQALRSRGMEKLSQVPTMRHGTTP
jgi:hypothetical protein